MQSLTESILSQNKACVPLIRERHPFSEPSMRVDAPFRFECPRCQQRLSVDGDLPRSGWCPACGQEFELDSGLGRLKTSTPVPPPSRPASWNSKGKHALIAACAVVLLGAAAFAFFKLRTQPKWGQQQAQIDWPAQDFVGLRVKSPQAIVLERSANPFLGNGASEDEKIGTVTGDGFTLRAAHFKIAANATQEFTATEMVDVFERDFNVRKDLTKVDQHIKTQVDIGGMGGVRLWSEGTTGVGRIVEGTLILRSGSERWILIVETLKQNESTAKRILDSVRPGPELALLKQLQGKWKVVKAVRNGEPRQEFVDEGHAIEFTNKFSRFLIGDGREEWAASFEIDATTLPYGIVFDDIRRKRKARWLFGFDGNRLRLGMPLGPEPLTSFTPQKDLPIDPAERSRAGIFDIHAERVP